MAVPGTCWRHRLSSSMHTLVSQPTGHVILAVNADCPSTKHQLLHNSAILDMLCSNCPLAGVAAYMWWCHMRCRVLGPPKGTVSTAPGGLLDRGMAPTVLPRIRVLDSLTLSVIGMTLSNSICLHFLRNWFLGALSLLLGTLSLQFQQPLQVL